MNTYDNESKKGTEDSVKQYIIIGNQVNISNDSGIINAKQINEESDTNKEIIIRSSRDNYSGQNGSGKNGEDGAFIFFAIAIVVAGLFYVKYRWQIQLVYIITTLVIEGLVSIIYFRGRKKGVVYDRNLEGIMIFNIASMVVVWVLMAIIDSPIYNRASDFELLEQEIQRNMNVQVFFRYSAGKDVLFQVLGMLFIGMLILYTLTSSFYILAVVNIAMERRGRLFWNGLLKMTGRKIRDGKRFIKSGIFLLATFALIIVVFLPFARGLLDSK